MDPIKSEEAGRNVCEGLLKLAIEIGDPLMTKSLSELVRREFTNHLPVEIGLFVRDTKKNYPQESVDKLYVLYEEYNPKFEQVAEQQSGSSRV